MSEDLPGNPDPKTFELTMRLRNNLLKSRRVALNLSPRELSEQIGIRYQQYLDLESLKLAPLCGFKFGRKGVQWRKAALKLAEFYRCMPEDLFPQAVLAVAHPIIVKTLEAADLCPILGSQCDGTSRALPPASAASTENMIEVLDLVERARLTPRERTVISLLYGLNGGGPMSAADVAKDFEVGRERIRQIEMKALRKLRRHAKSGYERAVESFLASVEEAAS